MKRIWLSIVILLAACSSVVGQPSILDTSSCDAPCWNGITAGRTSKAEIFRILNELLIVDQESITPINSPWKIFDEGVNFYLYPTGFFNRHSVWVDSNIINDKVADMSFCGNLGITFGDVVKETGDPKNIVIIHSPSGGRFVIAINQSIGVRFSYDSAYAPRRTQSEIVPEIPIGCLTYFDPGLYQKMLEAGLFSEGYYNARETLNIMYPWTGYGNLEEKYPLRTPMP